MRTPSNPETTDDVLRETLRRSVGGVVCAALVGMFVNFLYLIQPFYTLQIYDRVINGHSFDTLIMLTLLTAGIILFLSVLDFLRARIFMIVGEQMARRLGAPVMQAAVQDSLRSQSGDPANAMRDLQEVRQFVTSGPVALPFDAAMTPLLLAVQFLLHPLSGVVAIIGILLLVALGITMDVVARRPAVVANEAGIRSHADVATAIRHAEVIEAMGMLPALVRRWQQGQRRALFLIGIGNIASKVIATLARSVKMALQIGMLAAGAALVINQAASPGSMVAATLIMGRLLYPFEQIIEGWRQWTHALGALSRLRALLSGREADRANSAFTAKSPRLVAERLTFIPRGLDRAVLRGVGFSIEPGEAVGVIGPSGAGKSTLARLIVGIWRPTAGGLYLDGHDVYTWERESFGRQVGYLPQNPALLNGTVGENIARLTDCEPAAIIAAAKLAGVHELIGRLPLGYETRIGEGGFMLSGGQRQRVALARALFGSPRLLVLDEPNSNMDADGEKALIKAICEAKAGGATVIVVAQRTSVLAAVDKLMVLRDGGIERFGERKEVLRAMAAQNAAIAAPACNVTPMRLSRAGGA